MSPNSNMGSHSLKLHLFKFSIKERKCESCGLVKWLDKDIPLELHHIDGDNTNNSILNIQILCPNCHANTPHYRGKGKATQKQINRVSDQTIIDAIKSTHNCRQALSKCGLTNYGGTYVRIKRLIYEHNLSFLDKPTPIIKPKKPRPPRPKKVNLKPPYVPKTKIDWPDKDKLTELVKTQSVRSLGKALGVSDNAIRRRLKKYGVDLRPISPWSQRHGS
jgi:hypothetical protein